MGGDIQGHEAVEEGLAGCVEGEQCVPVHVIAGRREGEREGGREGGRMGVAHGGTAGPTAHSPGGRGSLSPASSHWLSPGTEGHTASIQQGHL